MKIPVLAAIAAFMTTGGAVSAATMTFSDSAPLADVEIAGTLSVAKFDGSLGTLTGVSWKIVGAIATILGVENTGTSATNGSAFTTVDFEVDAAELPLGASPDFSVFGTTGLVSLGVGASALFPVTATTTINGTEAASAAFIGPGTIDLSYMTFTGFGASGFGGDIRVSQATDAGLSFEITYEYDDTPPAIPLPASAMLLLGGLGALGLSRRKSV